MLSTDVRFLVRFYSPFLQFLDVLSILDVWMSVVVAIELLLVMIVVMAVVMVGRYRYRYGYMMVMMSYLKCRRV
jgi:hypothetical protein